MSCSTRSSAGARCYPLMPWATCPWCADSCSACSSAWVRCGLMSKTTFLMVPVNANGARFGVAAVDDAAVVAADVHARVAGEPERDGVVHPALADFVSVGEQADVPAGGGLGRVGVEFQPDVDLAGGQGGIGFLPVDLDAHHRVGVLELAVLRRTVRSRPGGRPRRRSRPRRRPQVSPGRRRSRRSGCRSGGSCRTRCSARHRSRCRSVCPGSGGRRPK